MQVFRKNHTGYSILTGLEELRLSTPMEGGISGRLPDFSLEGIVDLEYAASVFLYYRGFIRGLGGLAFHQLH